MPTRDPNFRDADWCPDQLPPELGGWNPTSMSTAQALNAEKGAFAALAEDMPVAFQKRTQAPILQPMWDKWNAYQESRGRGPKSADWTLLDEFVRGDSHPLHWLPQIIGSCVLSNTFRAWVTRRLFQDAFFGASQLGQDEFGPDSIAFWGPWSYGMMRKRGNLRGRGDGGFCKPMAESLLKDGVVPCSSDVLQRVLLADNQTNPRDMPEPQSKSYYRRWGDGYKESDVAQDAGNRLLECPAVGSIDDLVTMLKECKPAFVCSGLAIKKEGTHGDGFTIHTENRRSSWPHNMHFAGYFYDSRGDLWIRLSNQSWGKDVIYNLREQEVAGWFPRRVTSHAIGQIDDAHPSPPVWS